MKDPPQGIENYIARVGFEQARRAITSRLDERIARQPHCRPAVLCRLRSACADASRHDIGIAEHDRDVVEADAGQLAGEHGVDGRMTVTLANRAGLDERSPAEGYFDGARDPKPARRRPCTRLEMRPSAELVDEPVGHVVGHDEVPVEHAVVALFVDDELGVAANGGYEAVHQIV